MSEQATAVTKVKNHKDISQFHIVKQSCVEDILNGNRNSVVSMIKEAYLAHGIGETVNPSSQFLRFPAKSNARIIALPASINISDAYEGIMSTVGIKWIASFPDNHAYGIPRASAVIILNDPNTGYPIACLESSVISSARTAASAALGANLLASGAVTGRKIGIVGAGPIAWTILDYLVSSGWDKDKVELFDLVQDRSISFAKDLANKKNTLASIHTNYESLIKTSDLVIFATTAGKPYIHESSWFRPDHIVLHISLRDLGTQVIRAAFNAVDDTEHCLTANTSLHLLEKEVGHRGFVHATIDELIRGKVNLPTDKPKIFSPFGMGILDVTLAAYVLNSAMYSGKTKVIHDFFNFN